MNTKKINLDKIDLQSKIDHQHALGKKTALERINFLLDTNSFEEIDAGAISSFLEKPFAGDGVITGFGSINERRVALYAQDFTLKGGSLGKKHAEKICKIMDMAAQIGCPIIGLIDSGGARIDEGIHALAGYGEIFKRNVRYSGVIPQISLILGPCAGGAAYSPALTDFVFMVEEISQMFVTGPQVIKQAIGETITKEALGGAYVHAQTSGVAHYMSRSEDDAFNALKELLSFIPHHYRDQQPEPMNEQEELLNIESLVPKNLKEGYDIRSVIMSIVDHAHFFEIHENFAPNIVIGFAKLGSTTIGIVANQPNFMAGTIDINASTKAARFIKFCDAFSVPLISFVDVPGYLCGVDQEHGGIIRHGAKLLYAYAQASVPKITLILRKAFGGAYIAMASKHLSSDFNFAWPNAQIAVLSSQTAISILHEKKLQSLKPEERDALRLELEKDYAHTFLNPKTAAEYGYIDAIIEPNKTRQHLLKALSISFNKVEQQPKKKHGNEPL